MSEADKQLLLGITEALDMPGSGTKADGDTQPAEPECPGCGATGDGPTAEEMCDCKYENEKEIKPFCPGLQEDKMRRAMTRDT